MRKEKSVSYHIGNRRKAVRLVSFLFAHFTVLQCMMLKIVYACSERVTVTTDWADSSRRMRPFSEGVALKECA